MSKRVGVVARRDRRRAIELAGEVTAWLEARKHEVLFDVDTARSLGRGEGLEKPELMARADLVVVLGGDGTLLSVARYTNSRRVPVVGINLGGLGFLTSFRPEEAFEALEQALAGRYEVERRTLLSVTIVRGGRKVQRLQALNDVVINKGALSRVIHLETSVDGRPLTTFVADGLILSTPTGSTGYSLSAGGPVVDPSLAVLLLSPICAHTLTNRPIVLPDRAGVEVVIRPSSRDDQEIVLTIDGQEGMTLERDDVVRVTRLRERATLVRSPSHSWFELLRSKLRWSER